VVSNSFDNVKSGESRNLSLRELIQSRRSAAALVLLGAVHAPTLWAYGFGLLALGHYRMFPVIWIALLVLACRRSSPAMVLRWYHVALLALDGLLLLAGAVCRSPGLGFAGFCAGCLAVAAAGRDKKTGRSLWPLALLALVTLRPPAHLDERFGIEFQLTTARCASHVLSGLGVLHDHRGMVLESAERELSVDEACNDVHSLFTLLSLAVLIVVVRRRHWLASLLLLASSVAWALLLNIVRVVVIVQGDNWWGIDLASGWPRNVLGYVLVSVALICLISTDELLLWLASLISERGDNELGLNEVNPLVRAFNSFFYPPAEYRRPIPATAPLLPTVGQKASLLVVCAVVFAAQLISFPPQLQASPRSVGASAFAEEILAADYDGWKRGEYSSQNRNAGSMWGERSCQWEFFHGPDAAQVSLDYPFAGWHDLIDCYKNTGWQVTTREVRPSGGWPLVVAVMRDDMGRHGIVCFSLIDGEGKPVSPASAEFVASVADRWKRDAGRAGTYQVQAFGTALSLPGKDEIERLVRLHGQIRRDLARRFPIGTNRSRGGKPRS
jgi:exosortase